MQGSGRFQNVPPSPGCCTQVMQKLRSAPPLRQKIAAFFFAISTAYIKARRVVEGRALKYAVTPRPLLALLGAHLVRACVYGLDSLERQNWQKKGREDHRGQEDALRPWVRACIAGVWELAASLSARDAQLK